MKYSVAWEEFGLNASQQQMNKTRVLVQKNKQKTSHVNEWTSILETKQACLYFFKKLCQMFPTDIASTYCCCVILIYPAIKKNIAYYYKIWKQIHDWLFPPNPVKFNETSSQTAELSHVCFSLLFVQFIRDAPLQLNDFQNERCLHKGDKWNSSI